MTTKPKTKRERDDFKIEKDHGSVFVRMPISVFIGLLFAIILLMVMFWSSRRGRATEMRVNDAGELSKLIPSIVGLTQGNLEEGNKIEIMQNGDGFFPPLLRDIAAARESVHVESYIWWEGEICRQLATALATKARAGVEVRLLVDASGGRKVKEYEEMLTAAGVQLAKFHPVRISNLGRLNNRDHRKIMIIDGRIGYIGGHGIADEWTGNGQDRKHWRDTALRVEGPIVNRLQGAFCENWIEETGEIPAGDKYFPKHANAGPTSAHIAYTSPTGSVSSVQILYYLAIRSARRELIIQNPYLLPDQNAIAAIEDAVQRGVDVKIMVPAASSTDSPIIQHASHHHFGTLLKRGVKMWEYEKTLLHQKVMIVDGTWSCVGSTNFDDRSFQLNDEISMGVVDAGIAAELKQAFENDKRFARQRTFDEWKSRSLWHKMIDGLAYLGHEQY